VVPSPPPDHKGAREDQQDQTEQSEQKLEIPTRSQIHDQAHGDRHTMQALPNRPEMREGAPFGYSLTVGSRPTADLLWHGIQ
jgi:hypothetical protein